MNTMPIRWLRPALILIMLSVSSLACNLLALRAGQSTAVPGATSSVGAPVVMINTPGNGAEVVRGQEVLVQSTAQDNIGVTRVELRVNGFIVNTVSSESTGGDRQFTVIQSWTPVQAGPATLEVIAYRASVPSAPVQVVVNVRETAAQITSTAPLPPGVTLAPPEDTTCRARVEVAGLNFRTGPAVNYPILRVLELGTLVQIVGRLGDNSWWQVRDGLDLGWLSSAYTAESGDCSLIPAVIPPPSPTPRPATATPLPTATPSPPPGSPVPSATPTLVAPDLVVSAISGPEVLQLNASGTVGARYAIRVENIGTGNSGQFTTSFRRPDGTIIQLPIIVNLAPGQYADLPIDLMFTGSDRYRLEAMVDSGAQVAEYDEGNNVRTLDVVVTTQPMLSVTLPGGGVVLLPLNP